MNEIGSTIIDHLAQASVGGGIAVAVALAATFVFRKLNPLVISWIWRIALLKLVVSLFWISPLEIRILPVTLQHSQLPASTALNYTPSRQAAHAQMVPETVSDDGASAQTPMAWETWASLVWLSALLTLVAYREARTLKNRRFLQICRKIEAKEAVEALDEARRITRLRRVVPFLSTEQSISPVVLGLFRPVIVVPELLLEPERHADLRLVLVHEMCHLKRLDNWWTVLFGLTRSVLWFHPILWVSRGSWSLVQETACDALTRERSGVGAPDYAEALIRVLRSSLQRPAEGLAVVPMFDQKSMMIQRLARLDRAKLLPVRMRTAFDLMLLPLAALAVVPWRLAPLSTQASAVAKEPKPIGTVDWTVPTLQSDKTSAGFTILGMQRMRDTSAAFLNYNEKLLSIQMPKFETTIWVEVPPEFREAKPDAGGTPSDDFVANVAPPGGIPTVLPLCYAFEGDNPSSAVIAIGLPTGYPESFKNLDLSLAYKGTAKARWTLGNLPKSPVLISADAPIVQSRREHGMTFEAYAFRDTERHSEPDRMVEWGVISRSDPPKGQQWELENDRVHFERETPQRDYTNGSRGPVWKWPASHQIIPGCISVPDFSSTMKLAQIEAKLTHFETYSETVDLRGLSIEPSRSKASEKWRAVSSARFQIVNRRERRFTTGSGLSFTMPAQDGATEEMPLFSGSDHLLLLLKTDTSDHGLKLPKSPLYRRYRIPISESVQADGSLYVGSLMWQDGKLQIELVGKNLKPGPLPPLKLSFVQRVDLQTVPMSFVVPIRDRNLFSGTKRN